MHLKALAECFSKRLGQSAAAGKILLVGSCAHGGSNSKQAWDNVIQETVCELRDADAVPMIKLLFYNSEVKRVPSSATEVTTPRSRSHAATRRTMPESQSPDRGGRPSLRMLACALAVAQERGCLSPQSTMARASSHAPFQFPHPEVHIMLISSADTASNGSRMVYRKPRGKRSRRSERASSPQLMSSGRMSTPSCRRSMVWSRRRLPVLDLSPSVFCVTHVDVATTACRENASVGILFIQTGALSSVRYAIRGYCARAINVSCSESSVDLIRSFEHVTRTIGF